MDVYKKNMRKKTKNNTFEICNELLKLNDCTIYIGKSDNSDAIKVILDEVDFTAIFIGTPRHNENHRLDILNEVVNANPDAIILFPGLEDTLDQAIYR